MPIVFTSNPPRKPLRSDIGIIAVKAGESVLVRLLGPAVWVSVHWDGFRSYVCEGAEECPKHYHPRTDKGFVPVEAFGRNRWGLAPGAHLGVLQVTPEIGEDVAAFARGALLQVSRRAGKSNGPLFVSQEERKISSSLPDCFDVKPFVVRALRFKGENACERRDGRRK